MYGRGSHDQLTDSGDWREHIVLTEHRYMLEDTRIGLSFLVSVGELAGVADAARAGVSRDRRRDLRRGFHGDGPHAGELGLRSSRSRRACRLSCARAFDERARAIACLGAGRMGRGIAVVFAYAGHRRDAGRLQAARRGVVCQARGRGDGRGARHADEPRAASACSTSDAVDRIAARVSVVPRSGGAARRSRPPR